jgi:hypothetical protein
MASVTTLIDDIDGRSKLPAGSESTVIFVKDARLPNGGFHVEIDLSDKNVKLLGEAVATYRDNGREVIVPVPVTRNGNVSRDSESDGPIIRKWAQDNPSLLPEGVKVPGDRGALSKGVIAAYDAHHASDDGDDTDMAERPDGDDSKVADDV